MVAVPILVGACIVVGGFFNLKAALIHLRKKPAVPAALSDSASLRTLGVRLLRDDFGYLLEHYRRLEFDAHDKVKFPLAGC